MAFETLIAELRDREERARLMGGSEKLAKRKAEGVLNARERIDYLADHDSFLESGLLATSYIPEMRERSPADGKIAGYGRIDGREVAIVSNDFTVLGASSSNVNANKVGHMKTVASRRGLPMVFLGESTGARMPDAMGARGIGSGDKPAQYMRTRETPWASAVLGHCYGSSSWYAALADFSVMRKGAVMAVSSVKLTSMAIGEEVDSEALGGWEVLTGVSGLIDMAVDSDEEALDAVKRFLSYLPSHHNEAPPVYSVPAGSGTQAHRILDIVPESRTRVYDVRKIIPLIVDLDSMFEVKARYGKSVVTALARIDGRSVGIIANNPIAKGGAIDVDACNKATSFMVMCDSFNIPLVFLTDQPGFLIGIEGERRGAVGRVMNWMNALSLVTVPKIAIIMRKTYGQAVLNMGGAGNADELVAWVSAEVNFMDPRSGVTIVHGVRQQDEPEKYATLLKDMERDTSAWDMGAAYSAHMVINPVDTRNTLKRLLEVHRLRLSGGVGQHLMRTWPTSY
ncbi:acyl-CoA carboxylase subunit beta [Cupriavidus sp. EM10]|uniref:acyl-CoA carboxylase subunit beta n=1 Tax=Cupriavidus sp. EM10 TaxID=2839983 RepID=UPI001BFFE489|nr:carboxyl transferase domain-containing protein [Cupriavidus sp. EM10]QWE98169.1 methylmalonyl-CoA carboxyltransferase [Cupriavidus sp. EM10]